MNNIKEIEDSYSFNVYPKRDMAIVRGDSASVWDENGREYIDCVGGHGVMNIGHNNPYISKELKEQVDTLISCPGTFYNDIRGKFMEKLISITPDSLKKVFLCNSGTESVEAAIKFAKFTTGKSHFVAAKRSFHGRTTGSLSLTFNPSYRKPFQPLLPNISFASFNNIESFEEKITKETAAVIIEIIQGEGGINVSDKKFIRDLRTLCTQKNVLLIIDEIQTGFGRTGEMFACNHHNLEPDMLCLAKGMAGGVPMGAVLCSEQIKPPIGNHGSTFGGNPLACAAGYATLEYFEDKDLVKQSREKGAYFFNALKEKNIPKVREIRGLGLMIGIELKEKVKPYILKLIEQGVLTLPAGSTVLRLLPPLTISYEQLDTVVETIDKALR